MKRSALFLASFVFLLGISSQVLSSSIVDPGSIGVGARPLGMGKAYLGISDDFSGIFINPAALARNKSLKLGSMMGTLLSEFNYMVLGGSYPIGSGALSIGYVGVNTGGIPVTTLVGGRPQVSSYASYSNGVFVLSYADGLGFLPISGASWINDLTYGVNLKYYTQTMSGSSGISGGSGTGMDADMALSYKPRSWMTFGANLQNFLPANMGGKFSWATGATESIPFKLNLGGTAKILGADAPYAFKDHELYLSLDSEMSRRPMIWHLGAEWWPVRFFAFRMGIDQNAKAGGADNNLTTGIGLRYSGITFDYAYHQYGDMADNTTHYFSLGYIADSGPGKAIEPDDTTIIKPADKGDNVTIVVEKTEYVDVPEDFFAAEAIQYMSSAKVMAGYNEYFRPNQPINRAELAATLTKAKGITSTDKGSKFSDIPDGYWAANAINAAIDNRLMGGYPDNTFKPKKPLSRAEAVVVFLNFDNKMPDKKASSAPYNDVTKTNWAAGYIARAKELGWLDYIKGAMFDPTSSFTRAETAYILSKTEFGLQKIKELQGN
ncbi:MAG: S-layer homology domain-containing protein [bacterium]